MEFFKTVRGSNPAHWYEAFQWFLLNVICGLMPIWLPVMILYFFRQEISLYNLTSHGEFTLYSASFLGTSLYIVLRDFHKKSFPNRPLIVIFLFFILFILTIIFASVSLTDMLLKIGIDRPYELLKKDFLIHLSTILLLLIVFIISPLIFVVDLVMVVPDLSTRKQEEYDNLSEDFDKIKD